MSLASFTSGFTLFYDDVPGACLGGFVLLFAWVEPRVRNFGNGEFTLLFRVQEHANVLGGHHLVADNLLADFVFWRYRAELAKVGELGVGNGTRQAITSDVDGESHCFADLEVGAVEVCVKGVATDHAAKVGGLAFGRQRLYRNVHRGGLRFGFDRFLTNRFHAELFAFVNGLFSLRLPWVRRAWCT